MLPLKTVYHLSFSSPFGGAGIASRIICSLCNTSVYQSVLIERSSLNAYPAVLTKTILYLRKTILDIVSLIVYNHKTTLSLGIISIFGLSSHRLANASIIHLHWINGLVFPLWRLRAIDKPLVWQLHDIWPFAGLAHTSLRKVTSSRFSLPSITNSLFNNYVCCCLRSHLQSNNLHICVSSPHMRSLLLSHPLISNSLLSVIPLPLPNYPTKPVHNPFFQQLRSSRSTRILIVTGQRPHDHNKNISAGLSAAIDYCNTVNNASVLVAGRPHSHFRATNTQLTHLGFLPREDLFLLYQDVSVVVVPSYFESFSQVSLEALVSGTPVVCLRGSGVDSLPYNELIFASETDSTDHLSSCIRQAITAKLNLSASEITLRISSHNNCIAESYASIYDSLLA